MMMLKEAEGLWHKQFSGASEVEALARSSVKLPGNGIEVDLRETGEVGSLREILAQQAIGVLVDAALPYQRDEERGPFGQRRVCPIRRARLAETKIHKLSTRSFTGDLVCDVC